VRSRDLLRTWLPIMEVKCSPTGLSCIVSTCLECQVLIFVICTYILILYTHVKWKWNTLTGSHFVTHAENTYYQQTITVEKNRNATWPKFVELGHAADRLDWWWRASSGLQSNPGLLPWDAHFQGIYSHTTTFIVYLFHHFLSI
jgi:hypothetical protein